MRPIREGSGGRAAAAAPGKPASQLPEPGRFWIHYSPRSWPALDRPWVQLATARLGEQSSEEPAFPSLPRMAEAPLDDLLYLPPVPEPLAKMRDELARERLADGTPLLVQIFPGDRLPELDAEGAGGARVVVDLLPALLDRDLASMEGLPAGAAAVWTLLAGLTDDPALWDEGCGRLAKAGIRGVQALAPALVPADRRRLAESWAGDRDEAFDALFHRSCEAPAERAFARVADRHGFAPFLPRPVPRPPVQGGENRRLGGILALAAELWLRVGRPVEQGQSLYRAARWIDRTFYDVGALEREGNLGVLPPLDELSRQLVADALHAGLDETPQLVAGLLAEYLAPAANETEPTGRTHDEKPI